MTEHEADRKHGPAIVWEAGDSGLLIEFGAVYDPLINNAVLAFDAALSRMLPDGVIETVPSFRSVLIRFDPLALEFDRLKDVVEGLLAREDWYRADPARGRRLWRLPVVYGGWRGPDLAEVADLAGLREDQVGAHHAAEPLTVAMLGFSPGLAYLGQLPERWGFARRTEITPEVPAGAILVAVRQTVLPATPIPTGWRQIGQTPFRSFDLAASHPFLLRPGDLVQFESVNEAEFSRFDQKAFLSEAGQ